MEIGPITPLGPLLSLSDQELELSSWVRIDPTIKPQLDRIEAMLARPLGEDVK